MTGTWREVGSLRGAVSLPYCDGPEAKCQVCLEPTTVPATRRTIHTKHENSKYFFSLHEELKDQCNFFHVLYLKKQTPQS